ncbi:MAG: DUF4349 domain-containing protein [Acidimicrobiales bacterium]
MNDRSTKSTIFRALALVATAMLLAAACGVDNADSATSGSDSGEAAATTMAPADLSTSRDVATDDGDADGEAMADAPSDAPATSSDDTLGSGSAVNSTRTAAQLGREIIFTATVSVGVDDVEAAGREATRIIEEVGGFVFGQNTTGGAEARSEITFKVFPDDFSEALERLGSIGELRNQSITTDDVTERVVDLESRITTQELGVERLRTAMEAATDLEDFARLEQLLLSRESDLEVMKGQLRTLRDRIDLATITLVLSQDRVDNSISLFFSVYEGHDGGVGCPGTSTSDVVFEEGAQVTMCFDVRNQGDQTLTNIVLSETVLEIDNDDLIEVFESLDELRPGESAIAAYEFTPERDQRLRLSVSAVPTDGVSSDAVGPAVRASGTPVIRVVEASTDPGFGDGFDVAVGVLAALWTAVTVSAGFIVPMLLLLPLVWLAWFGIRGFRGRQEAKRIANQPPPPQHERTSASYEDENSDDEDVDATADD